MCLDVCVLGCLWSSQHCCECRLFACLFDAPCRAPWLQAPCRHWACVPAHTALLNQPPSPPHHHSRCSMLQQQSTQYRAAQFMGAALGVAIGCLIGMTPLFLMEPGFFVNTAQAAADVAAGAAALGSSGGLEHAAGAAAAVGAAAAAAADAAAAAPDLAGGPES